MSLKRSIVLLAAALCLELLLPLPALAQNPCEGGNLLANCNFDAFVTVGPSKQAPEDWSYFLEAGDPAFDQSPDTAFGAPSLRIWSDGSPFTAGIYQIVPNVTPGVRYQLNIGWAAANVMNIGRQLGIDPTGGEDSRSPNIIWGQIVWDKTRMPKLTVSAIAAGPKITVFVRVQHDTSYGADQCFLDAVSLIVDPEQPAAPTPAPTATPIPPTATRPPATATSVPFSPTPSTTPTAAATQTPTLPLTATPTATGTATATRTLTSTASSTPRPTRTPSATWTPRPTPTPTTAPFLGIGLNTWSNAFLGLGILGFVGVAGASGLLWWMSRSRRRDNASDDQ